MQKFTFPKTWFQKVRIYLIETTVDLQEPIFTRYPQNVIYNNLTFAECDKPMYHFTVVCSVTWPLNSSEGGDDLVLIQISLLLLCKSSCLY